MTDSGRPTIAALGGGGFSGRPSDLAIDRHLISLTGKPKPRVLFVPTASGDSPDLVARFFTAYSTLPCVPSWLPLFRRDGSDVADTLRAADLVLVGGGNTANMLAVWRVHGVDTAMRTAWKSGTVLSGVSAGAICWFDAGSTDSFGPDLGPLRGLGFLPGGFCPHYDAEAARRPRLHAMVAAGDMPETWAADEGCAFVFEGSERVDVVTSGRPAGGYLVRRTPGGAEEEPLVTRSLQSPDPPAPLGSGPAGSERGDRSA
jgi:peptidase E